MVLIIIHTHVHTRSHPCKSCSLKQIGNTICREREWGWGEEREREREGLCSLYAHFKQISCLILATFGKKKIVSLSKKQLQTSVYTEKKSPNIASNSIIFPNLQSPLN